MKLLKILIILLVLTFYITPFKTYANTSNINTPNIQSESAILMDSTTGQILYEKNSNQKMLPASLTKIATAIVAIEQGNLNDIVTVSQKAHDVDGTRVYLEVGEKVTLHKLLQGLLINSGNDAAIAIAEHMDGSVKAFSKRVNHFLINKVGTKNTHFTNPHGLYDPNHYTTAYDLALMMKYALKNEVFRDIISTKELKWDGEGWHTILYNHHQMLRERPYDGIIGGKTGYIDQSKHTLATAARRGNTELIAIVLKANTKKMSYDDTQKLLDYGFTHFQNESIPAGKLFTGQDKQTYLNASSILYKKKIGEPVKINVSHEGNLIIEGKDGNLILTSKLIPMKKNNLVEQPKIKKGDDFGQIKLGGVIAFALIFIFGIAGLVFKKVKERKNYSRYGSF